MSKTPQKKEQKKRGNPGLSKAKQVQVLATAIVSRSAREVSRKTGVSRGAVRRILSQYEFDTLVDRYRSEIIERIVPKAVTGLNYLVGKRRDRTAILQTLYGTRVFTDQAELKITEKPRARDYADAKIKFYYEKGRWPTLEEAKEFDKTIPAKLLLKGELE